MNDHKPLCEMLLKMPALTWHGICLLSLRISISTGYTGTELGVDAFGSVPEMLTMTSVRLQQR